MTSSKPIIPSFRALTIIGQVPMVDAHGELRLETVVDTTLPKEVIVVYELSSDR